MNKHFFEPITAELPLKLMCAIQDPAKWADVLDFIIAKTGAKAAIITLRDKPTCQIVNDTELEQKFHSPLIRGFSTEAIIHYLTNLRTIAPWAAFQRTYYPYRPVQMTKVCPPSTVKDTCFFEWLKEQGCEDTVVFERDRMAGYWTAINLFLEKSDGPTAERVVAFANANYDLLRNAWTASQTLTHSTQVKDALLTSAAHSGAPVCLAGANGEMIECNELFKEVVETGAVRLSGASQKLSFARHVSVQGLSRWEQHELLSHDAEGPPLHIVASAVDPDPRFPGKREKLWLLSCSNAHVGAIRTKARVMFNLEALTRQEKGLYRAIASGASIKIAGASIGLKRSRTFEVWSSVKSKLGIESAHQLRH